MHRRLFRTLIVGLLLASAACAPAAPPSPTAAPAKPAEAPKAAPPAKPTEAPAAKPAEKPAAVASPAAKPAEKPAVVASPAAKPAEKPAPAAKPAAKPEDIRVPKPSGNLSLKLGHPSTISIYDVPSEMVHERLKADGWTIESVQFTRTDLNTAALAQNQVQISIAQMLEGLRPIQQGAKMRWLMENNPPEFVMIARRDVARCEDLGGKRFAIHGETSSTSILARKWVTEQCKANPNVVVIPGGENRIVALMNNQIEATLVQLGDWVNLNAQAPGRFHIILTGGPFNVSGAAFWVNTDWLERNQEVATAYLAETLKTFRMIRANPKLLEEAMAKYLPEVKPESRPALVKGYIEDIKAWPANGGDTKMVEDAIKVYTEAGELRAGMQIGQVANTTILQNALRIVGQAPGER